MKLRFIISEIFLFILLFWFSFACEHLQLVYQEYILVLLGIGCLLGGFYRKIWVRFKNSLFLLFVIFVVTMVISIEFAYNKKHAIEFFYIPLFAILVFGLMLTLEIEKLKFKISYILSILAFLVLIFGLQEFLFHKNILYEKILPNPFYRFIGKRMISFHYHPSVLATYFLCVIPFSIFLIKLKRNQRDLIIGFLGLSASLSGILLTFTRMAFLILFICFSFYFLLTKKKYLIYIFLVFMILTSVATISINNNSSFYRFSPFNPYHIGSIQYRLERVPITFKIWMIQPITGVGLGNFRYLFNVFGQKGTPYEFKIPDNMYLSLLSETGILGLFSFFLFLFFLFYSSFKKIRNLCEVDREFLKISILGCCMLLFNMLSYDMFYWHMPLFFFWFYAGLIASFCVRNEPDL